MRLNQHEKFKVQLFEQIKKDDSAPSPTVPHLPLHNSLFSNLTILVL